MEVFFFDWWWTSHQSLAHRGLSVFRFSIVSWKDEDRSGSKVHRNTEPWIELVVSHMNSSGISFQDSPRCSSATNFKSYCQDWAHHQGNLLDGSSSCRCSTTSQGDQWTTRKNASQMLNSFVYFQQDLEQDNGDSLGLDLRRWSSTSEDSPQCEWDRMAEKMMVTLAENGHPVFRATSPLSWGVLRSKGNGKLSIHYCADPARTTTVFRTISFVNQLVSLYGAVAEMCEDCESYHDRTVRPVVSGKSSSKTNVPLNDDLAQKDLLQRYGERIENLSQQDRLSKFCANAGFLTTVEVGQYFMTKDTGDLRQFNAVASREYSLPREAASQLNGWIQGNQNSASVGSWNQFSAQ